MTTEYFCFHDQIGTEYLILSCDFWDWNFGFFPSITSFWIVFSTIPFKLWLFWSPVWIFTETIHFLFQFFNFFTTWYETVWKILGGLASTNWLSISTTGNFRCSRLNQFSKWPTTKFCLWHFTTKNTNWNCIFFAKFSVFGSPTEVQNETLTTLKDVQKRLQWNFERQNIWTGVIINSKRKVQNNDWSCNTNFKLFAA